MDYLRCSVPYINNNSWEDTRVSNTFWKIKHTFKKSNKENISYDSVKVGLYKKGTREELRVRWFNSWGQL